MKNYGNGLIVERRVVKCLLWLSARVYTHGRDLYRPALLSHQRNGREFIFYRARVQYTSEAHVVVTATRIFTLTALPPLIPLRRLCGCYKYKAPFILLSFSLLYIQMGWGKRDAAPQWLERKQFQSLLKAKWKWKRRRILLLQFCP